MRFLRKIEGVTMFDKLRNTAFRKFLNIDLLLLRIERFQLKWFGHLSKIAQERLPKQTLYVEVSGRRPVGRPQSRWFDYIGVLVGIVWDFIQAKCSLRWWIEKCGGLIWSCCPRNPQEEKRVKKEKDTSPNGHHREYTLSLLDTIPNGHDPERTQS